MLEKEKECCSANILRVKLKTNYPVYGDAGHGALTQIILIDEGSTAWHICIENRQGNIEHQSVNPEKIMLNLFGDTEFDTFIEAMQFIISNYRKIKRKEYWKYFWHNLLFSK